MTLICIYTLLLSSCGCEKCDFLSSSLASPNDVSNSLLSLKRSLSSSSSCSSSHSPSQYCSRHAQHGSTDDDDDFSKEAQFLPTALFLNRLKNKKCATCIREAFYSFCGAQVRKTKTFCLQVFCVSCKPSEPPPPLNHALVCLVIDTPRSNPHTSERLRSLFFRMCRPNIMKNTIRLQTNSWVVILRFIIIVTIIAYTTHFGTTTIPLPRKLLHLYRVCC